MRDLTTGNETRHIIAFTAPMLIGNIFQQLYTTVDSIIVGRALGAGALAAVGASFPVIFLLISLLIGVTMGATILISQYYGAKDTERVQKTINTTFIFLFIASLVVTGAGLLLSRPILLALNTPVGVLAPAQSYLNIIFTGMVALFGFNTVFAILRGLGDSRTPLYFLIVASILNIFLDLLFILGFNWGVAGAAWATIIAQGVSFALGVIYLNARSTVFRLKTHEMGFDGEIFRLSLKIGLPTGVQQMLLSFGMVALQSIVNSFGMITMAAFTAGMRIDSFASMPIITFGTAISTFVGQNLGANRMDRVRKGLQTTLIISSAFAVLTTLFVFICGRQLIALFNTDTAVLAIGAGYLRIVSSFYLVVSVMFILSGVMRGAGDTMVPMIISVVSFWIVRVPTAYFLSRYMGNEGIWWSGPTSWVLGLIMTLAYYLTGRWKHKVVVKHGPPLVVKATQT